MALAWWLVPCLPFPGLPHIYFLFIVRLANEWVWVFLARRSVQHLVYYTPDNKLWHLSFIASPFRYWTATIVRHAYFQVVNYIFSLTFRRKKVELMSSLRRQRLGRLSFLSRIHFSKTIKGIHLKLGILVHYQRRNQLQQGRWPCDLYIQSYLPLFRHSA
jgi:hypothetical protein